MYIDREDLERKLKVFSEGNQEPSFVPLNNAGRRKGDENLSDETRESVAKLANIIGPRAAAETLDVSYGTAVNAAKGMVGTAGNSRHKDLELAKKIKDQDDKIEETVLNKLLSSLSVITEDKLEALDPLKAATVAEKIANISKRKVNGANGSVNAIFAPIIHVPAKKEMKDYETVTVDAIPVS